MSATRLNRTPSVGAVSDGTVALTIHGEQFEMSPMKARVLAAYLQQKAEIAEGQA